MNTGQRTTESTESEPPQRIRLQRYLASAGLGSRRNCEEFIVEGRVAIDGTVVTELGTSVDPFKQVVTCDGEVVRPMAKKYFILNKPKGILCTNRDPRGRPRVVDFFGGPRSGLYPVGRLDENSQGLIFVTNDGELAEKLAHPRYRVPRTYAVQVAGFPSAETLSQLKKGLYFHEGKFRVQEIVRVRTQGESSILHVTLTEGQNREIRRLFARMGHKVLQLERIAFGPIRLGNLKVGDVRSLTTAEVRSLKTYRPDAPTKSKSRSRGMSDQKERRPSRGGSSKENRQKVPISPPPRRRVVEIDAPDHAARSERQPPRKGGNAQATGKRRSSKSFERSSNRKRPRR